MAPNSADPENHGPGDCPAGAGGRSRNQGIRVSRRICPHHRHHRRRPGPDPGNEKPRQYRRGRPWYRRRLCGHDLRRRRGQRFLSPCRQQTARAVRRRGAGPRTHPRGRDFRSPRECTQSSISTKLDAYVSGSAAREAPEKKAGSGQAPAPARVIWLAEARRPEHVNHERWLVSYADFITLLFAFFVVMFASRRPTKEGAAGLRLRPAPPSRKRPPSPPKYQRMLGGTDNGRGKGKARARRAPAAPNRADTRRRPSVVEFGVPWSA